MRDGKVPWWVMGGAGHGRACALSGPWERREGGEQIMRGFGLLMEGGVRQERWERGRAR